jgi:NAD(P)H dehydrogenase (quinone)
VWPLQADRKEIVMPKIVVAYHSGYGHTARVAGHIAKGAGSTGAHVELVKVEALDDAAWQKLDTADAIIFGAPTYMGSASAPFKAFEDATVSRWVNRAWAGKLAAGFTNSGSPSGDKLSTLMQIFLFAQQHGMLWHGLNLLPSEQPTGNDFVSKDALNRLGGFAGLLTQANNDAPESTFTPGDLKTAEVFGTQVATASALLTGTAKAAGRS